MKMKHILLTGIAWLLTAFAWAQQGTVSIHQDAALDKLLYQNKHTQPATEESLIATGYRVQIYSSNASRKAKETAFEWKKNIEETYPNQKAYVVYQAPFWKVRVGDFTHYAEAVLFSKDLAHQFPKQAGEIIVVKEKQVKPLYFNNPKAAEPTVPQTENTL